MVDDKEAVRAALEEAGVDVTAPPRLDFLDPWGNRVEIVDYRDIQFTKAPAVLAGMGLEASRNGPLRSNSCARRDCCRCNRLQTPLPRASLWCIGLP